MVSQSKKTLAPATNLGAFKGGSLPNVSEQNRKQQTTNAQIVDAANISSKKVQIKYSQCPVLTKILTLFPTMHIFFLVFLENILFNIIWIAPCMYACLLLMTYQLLQKKFQSILNIQLKLVGKIPKQIFRFKILILLCLNSFSSWWMNCCRFYSTMWFLHTFQWIIIASLTMFSGIECPRLLAFLFWEKKKPYIEDLCMIFVHCVSNMLCSVFKLKMKILVLFLFLK